VEVIVKTTAKIIFYLSMVMFVLSLSSVLFAEELKDSQRAQPHDGTVIHDKAIEAKSNQVTSEKKEEIRYISANLGLAMVHDTYITNANYPTVEPGLGFVAGAAMGFGFDYGRFEVEISYEKNNLEKARIAGIDIDESGSVSNIALLVIGYLEFKNKTAVTPYLSAGMGVDKYNISAMPVLSGGNLTTESHDATLFAYQFGAGVGYAVTEKLTIDLKYRYFATSNAQFGDTTLHYGSHNICLGVRFAF
jgi:opacity protein-like surface antigen